MKIVKEFREFAMKGNVMDIAVGIIIGAAFGKIVTSLVNDVIMPPIGVLVGGVDFTSLKINMVNAYDDEAGNAIEAVTINYGNFLQTTVDFLIVAFAIFIVVKLMNRLKKKEEEKPAAPPAPSKEEALLAEIRDLLKK